MNPSYLFAVLALFGCIEQSQQASDSEPPMIVQKPPEQIAEEEREREERRQAYERALSAAPTYSSSIRTFFFDNPDLYRQTYRVSIDDFRYLPRQFRCIHPTKIINALASENWELVKCDSYRAIFFRRHGQAVERTGKCLGEAKGVPHDFETLTLFFRPESRPWATIYDAHKRMRSGLIHGRAIPILSEEVDGEEDSVERFDVPEGSYSLWLSDGANSSRLAIFDNETGLLVQKTFRKNTSICYENAMVARAISGMKFTLDSPIESYPEAAAKSQAIMEILVNSR